VHGGSGRGEPMSGNVRKPKADSRLEFLRGICARDTEQRQVAERWR
jgi:hypothetical protein